MLQLKERWLRDRRVDYLMEGEEEGQFQGQKGGRGLRLRKIVVKRAVGLILRDQIRTRMVRVSRNPGLFEEARKIQLLECRIEE